MCLQQDNVVWSVAFLELSAYGFHDSGMHWLIDSVSADTGSRVTLFNRVSWLNAISHCVCLVLAHHVAALSLGTQLLLSCRLRTRLIKVGCIKAELGMIGERAISVLRLVKPFKLRLPVVVDRCVM